MLLHPIDFLKYSRMHFMSFRHRQREEEAEDAVEEVGVVEDVAGILMTLRGLHQSHLSRARIVGCQSKTQMLSL
jgi:hypothetical protein